MLFYLLLTVRRGLCFFARDQRESQNTFTAFGCTVDLLDQNTCRSSDQCFVQWSGNSVSQALRLRWCYSMVIQWLFDCGDSEFSALLSSTFRWKD